MRYIIPIVTALAVGMVSAPAMAQAPRAEGGGPAAGGPPAGGPGGGGAGAEVRPPEGGPGGAGQRRPPGGAGGRPGAAMPGQNGPGAGGPGEPKSEGARPGESRPGQAGQGENRPGEAGRGQNRPRPAAIRPEQRTRIVDSVRRLDVRPVPVAEIGVGVAVGAVIPHRDILRPLPAPIVEIVPEYSGYLFVETPVDILIVDPVTLEIVDVLPI